MELKGTCYQCGKELSGGDYARSESCPGCDSDTRVCRNCDFYDPTSNSGCHEPAAELVRDKTRANFCEFFRPGKPKQSGSTGFKMPGATSGDAKSAFDNLFKKKPD